MGLKDVARRLREPNGARAESPETGKFTDIQRQEVEGAFDSPMMIMNQIHEA